MNAESCFRKHCGVHSISTPSFISWQQFRSVQASTNITLPTFCLPHSANRQHNRLTQCSDNILQAMLSYAMINKTQAWRLPARESQSDRQAEPQRQKDIERQSQKPRQILSMRMLSQPPVSSEDKEKSDTKSSKKM